LGSGGKREYCTVEGSAATSGTLAKDGDAGGESALVVLAKGGFGGKSVGVECHPLSFVPRRPSPPLSDSNSEDQFDAPTLISGRFNMLLTSSEVKVDVNELTVSALGNVGVVAAGSVVDIGGVL
jgi:hypothetical protein